MTKFDKILTYTQTGCWFLCAALIAVEWARGDQADWSIWLLAILACVMLFWRNVWKLRA